ncbi:MAG: HEAT repeat domain-containing protein [Planctomycetota bacterium]|jgi:HEAT repeat protein
MNIELQIADRAWQTTGRGSRMSVRTFSLHALFAVLAASLLIGCAPANPFRDNPDAMAQLKQRALECLKRGIRYDYLPSVRIGSIESLQEEAPEVGLPWIRTRLHDEHPAVRFAACMALGALGDEASGEAISPLLDDPDDNVKLAAIFALHRLGDVRHTGRLAEFLRTHPDQTVRRNAALALGRLGEPGAAPLLAKAVNSKDEGLHAQALESLALLGNEAALQQLTFVANSGVGPQEVFALNALALTRSERFQDTFAYKLEHGDYLETRLAAARGLGEIGSSEGLEVALEGIRFNRPQRGYEQDPEENQIMRMRQMAAMALGAIGDPAGLPSLAERLEDNHDPRVQVAAAKAILRIANQQEQQSLPFPRRATAGR